ncbi:agmatine deiminase [Parabacteroides sp. PF5-5]|uniref:agmatine deiminase family protein n=1 Tax=unclassified Parabacteroides TaxID=2649774 RepID=UPI0024730936|nr:MULTISPECIES: agmatine deiminase family protein [unclassified Parabacteroides]MDH6304056.1 agmatine deiminase [Parabacteroides sp. PH5-39]MDH6315141.1 agmatine deiminase [Parabacteroides sp. PF5-13]MDH6318889.1 agmatine deiminase [Parabacteroides sp. PH5-13]MDH6322618.1 agmatine deiminase [Parabacteroides sp. PH5-8]MDH6326333.1 agmatine deiminase [Parabacteroides sp. PH5-41]
MITDRETNFVYFSSLIKEKKRYYSFWKRLENILIDKRIGYGFIENTRDIWCRDYMPIQTGISDFVQFDYFPDYYLSPKYIDKLTIPSDIRVNERMNVKKVNLVIDGGNVVKSASHVILTEKVLKDNPQFKRESIIAMLKRELNVKNVCLMPQVPYDMTGHADGMVRFLNDTDLLVADYSYESKSWQSKMNKALENTGLNIIRFPSEFVDEKNENGDYTAKGVYINFVQIGEYILLPQFGLNMDEVAFDYAKKIFSHCKVIPVNSNEIAIDGGVLNCITWNVRVKEEISFCKLPLKRPDHTEQEYFVFNKLDFYLSTFDYLLIAKGFESIWNNSSGMMVGDGDFKNAIYRFLEQYLERNFIPQYYVDRVIDLILEYMESIGQYGFPICEN